MSNLSNQVVGLLPTPGDSATAIGGVALFAGVFLLFMGFKEYSGGSSKAMDSGVRKIGLGIRCHTGGRRHRGDAPGVVPEEGRTRQLIGCGHRMCRRRRYLPAGLLTSSMRTFDGSSTNATRRSLTSRGSPVTCTPFCFSSAIFASISGARQPR